MACEQATNGWDVFMGLGILGFVAIFILMLVWWTS